MNDSSDPDTPKPQKIIKFWSFIKSLKKDAFQITSLRENGVLKTDSKEKAVSSFPSNFCNYSMSEILCYICTSCVKVDIHTIWCHFGQFKFVQKTIFKEIPTKAIYQYEKCLFCNAPKLLFKRSIISIL